MHTPQTPLHAQHEPPTVGEYGGYPIYPMPAFTVLTVRDMAATERFYTEALDFGVLFRGPQINGVPMLVHLRRARYQDVLVRHGREATQPATGLAVTFAAVDATAVDALAEGVRSAGGTIVSDAADMPWHTHELTVADPDGNQVAFTARAAGHEPRDFNRTMEDVADRLR